MEDLVGRKLGKYELLQRLGEGGMGAVYRSFHPQLNRPVAIKILPPVVGQDSSFRVRFQREGQTMASLNHPNIIRVYDVDEQDGLYYMVMDYVEGGSLAQRLESGTPMGLYWACDLVARVAEALHYAHRKGIVHRDIKPANILLTAEEDPIVADFGIAKLLHQEGENLTAAGSVVGTPAYMAPEQILAGEVDGRSDLYSLGIVLYQLLTGHPPFTGDTMTVITQQINAAPPPPRTIIPDLPKPLEDVILQALAKQPAHRFANGAAFAAAIRNALQAVGPAGFVRAAPAVMAAAKAEAPRTVHASPAANGTAHDAGRGTNQLVKLGAGALVAIVALVVVWQIIKALFVPLLLVALAGGFYWYRSRQKSQEQRPAQQGGQQTRSASPVQRGLAFYRSGHFTEALTAFNAALKEDPNNIDALISRGLAYYTLGDLQKAETDFEMALGVNPRHPRALYQRALVHQALGRIEQARQDLEQVLAIIPTQAHLRREAEARLQSLSQQAQPSSEIIGEDQPAPAAQETSINIPAPTVVIAEQSGAETVIIAEQNAEQGVQQGNSREEKAGGSGPLA
ncbi:MAG: hypothetical protein KatS3mg057_0542 [Herpetosiphonaceae bacterium]|nr:MAG: hypothetical protein KatS3mg057_0542 [Herpetosiphonaceae bacterium]